MYVVPPSWADAMAWHPWDEDNTNFLKDVLTTDDDPDPTQEDASDPPGWLIRRLSDPQKKSFLGSRRWYIPPVNVPRREG